MNTPIQKWLRVSNVPPGERLQRLLRGVFAMSYDRLEEVNLTFGMCAVLWMDGWLGTYATDNESAKDKVLAEICDSLMLHAKTFWEADMDTSVAAFQVLVCDGRLITWTGSHRFFDPNTYCYVEALPRACITTIRLDVNAMLANLLNQLKSAKD